MEATFTAQAAQAGITPGSSRHGLSAYQLVIGASIVEKEGYYLVNMPKVGRVILNRLARGGGLQMDATILYYFGADGGRVTPAMLRTETPYNTLSAPGSDPNPDLYALGDCAARDGRSSSGQLALLHADQPGRHDGLLDYLRRATG
jgi:cell division protein YceG involved in septum cleavage